MTEDSAFTVDEVQRVLEDLRALSGEISSLAVLSGDGELEGSTLPPGVDQQRYAAMVAALAGLARRIARENGGAGFSQLRVREETGHVLLVGLEGGGALVATADPDARVGLVLYDMRNARADLERALRSEGGQG